MNQDKEITKANLKSLIKNILNMALAAGVVITVATKPRSNLAMGNYDVEVDLRDARHNSSPEILGNVSQRVVCAAIAIEGTVLPSARHCDFTNHILINAMFPNGYDHDKVVQGFIDQRGKFLTREEAWIVANNAGQIFRRLGGDHANGGCLYSENLY